MLENQLMYKRILQELRRTTIYGGKIIIFKILQLQLVPLRKSCLLR